MAKTLVGVAKQVCICWGDVAPKVRFISVGQPRDTVTVGIAYDSTGNPLANPAPRNLTAGELAGTVQTLLDAIDAEANVAEGIA